MDLVSSWNNKNKYLIYSNQKGIRGNAINQIMSNFHAGLRQA